MAECPLMSRDVALTFIDDIPVIGIRYSSRRLALCSVKEHMERVNELTNGKGAKVKILFKRQPDGRYQLGITNGEEVITFLENVDELLLKRFRKNLLKKNLFILTCFVKEKNKELECLVLTEGLGTVIYSPKNMI